MTRLAAIRSRALGQMFSRRFTAAVFSFFWAVSAAIFYYTLRSAEGSSLSLPTIWCSSVSLVLPFVAAFLGMGAVSSDCVSGRMEMLLTTPVSEREIILGKYAAVLLAVLFWLVGAWAIEISAFRFFASSSDAAASVVSFLPGVAGLFLQGALWSALAVMFSSFMKQVAVACVSAIFFSFALPRFVWYAVANFFPAEHFRIGQMPFDAHLADFASGVVSVSTLGGYSLAIFLFLFLAASRVSILRLAGAGGARARLGIALSMVSCVFFVLSVLALASRFPLVVNLPLPENSINFSRHTLSVISETRGVVRATCFAPRRGYATKHAEQFLRAIKRGCESHGGAEFQIFHVDPDWDISSSRRLVRSGVKPPAVVFESSRRRAVISLDSGIDERKIVSAFRKLTTLPSRRSICWTVGHGELSFDDYGLNGMSDIARSLREDGYENKSIDLAGEGKISSDCALVVVAGAKTAFSRQEETKMDEYLRKGGRLLVLTSSLGEKGVLSLLPRWGMRASKPHLSGARTFTGSDVVVSNFHRHPITEPLEGTQLVFDSPVAFTSSAAAVAGSTSADAIEFIPLIVAGDAALAAATERGASAQDDIFIRPTRIIAVGDETFAVNSQLKARSNANRNFFINAVTFLAGSDSFYGEETCCGTFSAGLDIRAGKHLFVFSVLAMPAFGFFAFLAVALWRKRR